MLFVYEATFSKVTCRALETLLNALASSEGTASQLVFDVLLKKALKRMLLVTIDRRLIPVKRLSFWDTVSR